MITQLLMWLFWPCRHNWTIHRESEVYVAGRGTDIPNGREYHLRCEKCGCMKQTVMM